MSHISNKEIQKSLFSIDKNQEEVDDSRHVQAFGNYANELLETDLNVYAKIIKIANEISHWILFSPAGRMINPYGLYEESRRFKGKKAYQFRKVNPRAFEFYIDFLRTRNHALYAQAERENI